MIVESDSRQAELLRACAPWEDGTLAMLRAYVDAGTQGGVMAVAVVCYGLDRAIKAERAWRQVFGGRVVRMANLHNGKGPFAEDDKDERSKLLRDGVDVVLANVSHIAVISCDVSEVRALGVKTSNPDRDSVRLLDGFMNPYPACLHWAMSAAGTLAGRQKDPIAYFIESGDEFQGQADAYLGHIRRHPHGDAVKGMYQMGAVSILEKSDMRLFDTADVVAWEWARHVGRVRAEEPSRKSLVALMGGSAVVNGHPYVSTPSRLAAHYSGEQVQKFFDRMDRLLNASSVADVMALNREIDRDGV